MIAVALPLAFVAGLLIADAGGGALSILLLALAALLAQFVWRLPAAATLAALVLLGAGYWRADVVTEASGQSVAVGTGKPASYRAAVVGPPRVRPERIEARLRLQPSGTLIDVTLPPFPLVAEGDLLRIRTTLPLTGQPADQRVFVTSFAVLGSEARWYLRARDRVNLTIRSVILGAVPQPAGSLALGVVTGDDKEMAPTVRDAFRRAGLSHITAVSGWNLTIVAGILILFLRRACLPRSVRLVVALIAIWATAFLVGMVPSAVRAAAMASLFAIGRYRGRPADVLVTMLWAVALLVAITPALRFDVGFQFSVAATLALASVAPWLIGRPVWLAAVVVPAAAELAIAPLALHHFGSYSLAGPLSNLLAEALVSPIMLASIAVVLLHLLAPALAELLGVLIWVPARLVVLVAETTSHLPALSGRTVGLGWSGTVLSYGAMILGWQLLRQRSRWAAWLRGEEAGAV